MKFLLPVVALLALGACSTKTQVADVAAAEAALTASGNVALAYMSLPPCGTAGVTLCSSPTVKAQIKTAYDTAYQAATTAQAQADAGQTPDLTALNTAIATLQNIVAVLPKQGA